MTVTRGSNFTSRAGWRPLGKRNGAMASSAQSGAGRALRCAEGSAPVVPNPGGICHLADTYLLRPLMILELPSLHRIIPFCRSSAARR
jgi:hypothetical protein